MAEQLKNGYQRAELSVEDRALCDYAAKLTRTPGEMGRSDIERLRGLGFSEEQITIATQVISYFNYINRVADGLGVDPEDWMQPSEAEWRRRKNRSFRSWCRQTSVVPRPNSGESGYPDEHAIT